MNAKPTAARGNRWLLSLAVVAAAVCAIVLIRHRDRKAEAEASRERRQPLEVSNPFEMSGEIVSASWREGTPEAGEPAAEPEEERLPTPEEDERRRRERELRKVLDRVEGLGVYVAPPEEGR